MKHQKNCNTCIRGTFNNLTGDVLCRDKGAVSPEFSCSNYRPVPMLIIFKHFGYNCLECDNFFRVENESNDYTSEGICCLFPMRQYNGSLRKACSKFSKGENQKACL